MRALHFVGDSVAQVKELDQPTPGNGEVLLKMKASGFLAFAILSISILSFGLTGAVNAQSVLPVSVETDFSSYTTGNSIVISGFIKNLSEYASHSNNLVNEIIKEAGEYQLVWESRTTKFGFQGPTDIFENPSKNMLLACTFKQK